MVSGIISHMARCTAPVRGPSYSQRCSRLPRMLVAAMAAPAATRRIRPRPTSRRGVAGAAGAAAAAPAAAQGRAGRELVSSLGLHALPRLRALNAGPRQPSKKRAPLPELRDGPFLCHAWDDRRGGLPRNCMICSSYEVSRSWFSEKDVALGTPLLPRNRQGTGRKSRGRDRAGDPCTFCAASQEEGIADKELSALLARDLLVPIVHDTDVRSLSAKSAPCSAREAALSTAEIPWHKSRPSWQSWSPSSSIAGVWA